MDSIAKVKQGGGGDLRVKILYEWIKIRLIVGSKKSLSTTVAEFIGISTLFFTT